jgi:hypothetical protein
LPPNDRRRVDRGECHNQGANQNVRRDLDDVIVVLRATQRDVDALRSENVALRTELALHVRHSEKWDNRVWTIVGLFLGSLLALASALIVNSLKK